MSSAFVAMDLVFLLASYEVWCEILAPQNDSRINYSKWSDQADGKTAFQPFKVGRFIT